MLHAFFIRLRTMLAFIIDPLRKAFAMKTSGREFASQRMCPFCGLITPPSKPFCLECGKSLRGIQLGQKDAKQG
jgi:hypothetical protein